MKPTSDALVRRMESEAISLGGRLEDSPLLIPGPGRRWHVDRKWITFECGCVAQRLDRLACEQSPIDPVIFDDVGGYLSLYYSVCRDRLEPDQNIRYHHTAAMNKRIGAGVARDVLGRVRQFGDFKDWYSHRRPLLIGA